MDQHIPWRPDHRRHAGKRSTGLDLLALEPPGDGKRARPAGMALLDAFFLAMIEHVLALLATPARHRVADALFEPEPWPTCVT